MLAPLALPLSPIRSEASPAPWVAPYENNRVITDVKDPHQLSEENLDSTKQLANPNKPGVLLQEGGLADSVEGKSAVGAPPFTTALKTGSSKEKVAPEEKKRNQEVFMSEYFNNQQEQVLEQAKNRSKYSASPGKGQNINPA